MSAPMPERVLTPDVFNRLLGFYRSGRGGEYDAAADTLNTHDTALCDALLAAEARVRELQAPVMCSVCVGRPLPSGRPCICGDTIRTEAAEMHGLRVRCFELENENAALRAERDALMPLARVGLFLRDKLLAQVTDPALREHFGWCLEEWGVAVDGGDTPTTTQARAILAREVGA